MFGDIDLCGGEDKILLDCAISIQNSRSMDVESYHADGDGLDEGEALEVGESEDDGIPLHHSAIVLYSDMLLVA